MADYYPLIVRAIEGLADRSPETRRAIYDRARYALLGQLRSLDPPLSEEDIERERKSLESAFARIEAEQAAPPEPPSQPAAAPAAAGPAPAPAEKPPAPAEVAVQARDSIAEAPSLRGERRSVPSAAPKRFESVGEGAPPQEPPPRAVVPARLREVEKPSAAPQASVMPAPVAPSFPAGREALDATARGGDEIVDVEFVEAEPPARPRVDTRSRVAVRSRRFPAAILGTIVLAAVGSIAVAAFLLRDDPGDLTRQPTVAGAPAAPAEGPKLNERVGGQTPSPPPSAPSQAPPARVEPGAPQRAVLYVEDPANPNTPKANAGRVVWQLEAVNAGQGQALESAIRAQVELPEMGMSLSLLIRRNLEATLPASHTVELAFTTAPGDPGRAVRDVGLLQFKTDFSGRGTPAAGLTVPVRENVFLIGLSSIQGDVERNMELLRQPWVDLPIRTVSGQRAVLSFEKGASGDQVVEDAFRQWR